MFQDKSNSKIKKQNLDRTVESDLILKWNHKLSPDAFSSGPGFHSKIRKTSIILLMNLGSGWKI